MKITIDDKIGYSTIGDWDGAEEHVANSLASATMDQWRADLLEIASNGHEIVVNVEVNENGTHREPQIFIDNEDDLDAVFEMEKRVENLLTNPNDIFNEFCQDETSI